MWLFILWLNKDSMKDSMNEFYSTRTENVYVKQDWLQVLHSIWNGQIKLRTSTQCETHLPPLDIINSWSERGKSDRFMGQASYGNIATTWSI